MIDALHSFRRPFQTFCRRSGLLLVLVSTPMAMAAFIASKQTLTLEQPSTPIHSPEQVEEAPSAEELPIPSKQTPYELPESHSIA